MDDDQHDIITFIICSLLILTSVSRIKVEIKLSLLCRRNNVDFLNLWSLLDILSIMLIILSSALHIYQSAVNSDDFRSEIKSLYSLTILSLGARLLSFSRGFKRSSFLINLLLSILQDIHGLFIIFIFLVSLFTF